jgi:transcriptional regulator with XRE-family HTH domain
MLTIKNGWIKNWNMKTSKLYRARIGKGLTLEQAGKILGVATTTVWMWEHEKTLPNSVEMYKKLKKVFGVEPNDIIRV